MVPKLVPQGRVVVSGQRGRTEEAPRRRPRSSASRHGRPSSRTILVDPSRLSATKVRMSSIRECSPMHGPEILVRTLSVPGRVDRSGKHWQYLSRSDYHSKLICWGIVVDLLSSCSLLRRHVAEGKIGFGINHEMRDFVNDRKKNLDLVLCSPSGGMIDAAAGTLATMANTYSIQLTENERADFLRLPTLHETEVGSVLMALEAKACMTAHQRALPRLFDELNSSHLTVHGATDQAIAVGFVMVNAAEQYLSPDLNKTPGVAPHWSVHNQPRDAELAVNKVRQLRKRSKPGEVGYDALSVLVVDCRNDGSPIRAITAPPAPPDRDIYNYVSMIDRMSHIYATRFKDL